jgi:transcription elongation factor GreA
MANITYLTQDGYNKVKVELAELKTTGRMEAAAAIAEARDKGDLSENAEYDAAKNAQGMLEMRISELEALLGTARVLDGASLDTSEVRMMLSVTIKNVKNGMKETYKLVSETEANLKEKRISAGSPIGKGLLGKKVGEIATVLTPAGKVEFEVLHISS